MAETAVHKNEVREQFTQQAESYSRLTQSMVVEDRQAAFRALFQPQPDDRALDVCCGPGGIALDVAPHVAQVTGLDLTPAMLDQARAAQADKRLGNLDWVVGDVCEMPFDDGAFSLVLCGAAFHHLTDPRAAFAEMVRVCRPGGRIVVRDLTPAADKSAAYDAIERARDSSHTHVLTPEEMAALGEGLAVNTPTLTVTIAADIPLDPILATSFPTGCTVEDIGARLHADAVSGEDRFGMDAHFIDGRVHLSYPGRVACWERV